MIMRKVIIVTLAALLVSIFLISKSLAQDTLLINYQGRFTDDGGNPITGTHAMIFTIYDGGGVSKWTEAHPTVEINDGLFNVILGSHTSLPDTVFGETDRYLGIKVGEDEEMSPRTLFTYSPYAAYALHSDTAEYAHASPGGASTGWVDDGTVVRLVDNGDYVGIGTSTPNEPLVVGKDLGGTGWEFIVIGNDVADRGCGLKIGEDDTHHSTMTWSNSDDILSIATRTGGSYNNELFLNGGNVGIAQQNPNERLVVGADLGSYSGNRIVVGDNAPADYTGFMMGEDADNRAFFTWSIDGNFLGIGVEDEGTQWNNMINLNDGEVSVGVGSGNSSVQLPNDAISDTEILDEPGIGRAAQGWETSLPQYVWTTVCTRSCEFPTSGYAVVLVCCDFVTEACEYNLAMGIARNGTSAPRTYNRQFYASEGVTCYDWQEPLSIHEVFQVDAGTNTFNFMANSYNTRFEDHMNDVSMTIMFFPTNYGTVNAKAQTDGEDTDLSKYDAEPMLFTDEELAVRNEPVSSEADQIAALRAEFEAELQTLKEEIAELKSER